ncbi:sensor domain-containing diguanylate cyclase [Belnapia sp. T18]|uniref:Sensor domain-containing diguanylate cyclase n=1 Tax=Belnapia arida TaxID=2804533 RepID=A0ABS1TXA9_9PROT|nr:sensor domain-containing diguanylate cyclase [Belnapia arida]MBL6077078.1 sensor domain-containing diguanylate cyclase [Belnapia arida]
MPAAPLPPDETGRLAALRSYAVLDTACEAAFDDIVRLAARLTRRPIALVSLIDAERIWAKARHGAELTEAPRNLAFCAHAILDPGQPLVIEDARVDPRFADNPLVHADPGLRSYTGIPLVNAEGFALGTLCVLDHAPRSTSEEELEILSGLARSVSTALELRRAMRRMHDLAVTDGLTGLPNRSALMTALDATLAVRCPFTLLFIDLDGFKGVNDRLGHAAGDAVLRAVADVLRAATCETDSLARLGGDEFCVLLGETAGAAQRAERIRLALAEGMARGGWPVTASIGSVGFDSMPASAEAALSAADAMMYAAKAGGKDQVRSALYEQAG